MTRQPEGIARPEQPGREPLHVPGDHGDHDDADRPARDRGRHALPDGQPALVLAGHQHAPQRPLQVRDVAEQEHADEDDREGDEEAGEEVARDADHAGDRVRHRRRDLLRARLHVLGSPAVAQPGELVGSAQLLDQRRKILEKVSNTADERHQEQQPDQQDQRERAEHQHRRRRPARHLRLRHQVPQGELEHERQEDPDEHDQEGVADRRERREHTQRRSDQQHRSHRQDQLDASRLTCAHFELLPAPGAFRELLAPRRRSFLIPMV